MISKLSAMQFTTWPKGEHAPRRNFRTAARYQAGRTKVQPNKGCLAAASGGEQARDAERRGAVRLRHAAGPFVMRIRAYNDALRINGQGGEVFLSSAVTAKGDAFVEAAYVQSPIFDRFSEDQRPPRTARSRLRRRGWGAALLQDRLRRPQHGVILRPRRRREDAPRHDDLACRGVGALTVQPSFTG